MDKAIILNAINKFMDGEPLTEEELTEFKAHIISFGLLTHMEDEVKENIRDATMENYETMLRSILPGVLLMP
jgi:hypothetical protein